jgi:molybdate transport system permease protein
MGRSPLPWLSLVIVLYLGVPLVAFALRLISTNSRGFHNPGLFPALYISMVGATISLALIAAFGIPLAYLLARSKGPVASAVGVVVQLPLALPPLMSGIILIYLVGPYTTLGKAFGGHLTDSLTGVVLAMTFVAAPFLIVAARAAFEGIEPTLLDVASTLGHSELARFGRVALPVAAPGIRAGMLLAWLRAFGEFGAVMILAYHPTSLPIYTYNQFSGTGLDATLAPTALALLVAGVAVALSRIRRRARAGLALGPSSIREAGLITPTTPPQPLAHAPVRFEIDHRVASFHLELAHHTRGTRLAILGPSGSGKSALLRCLAGLYGDDPGPVYFGDDAVHAIPVERRQVGYVAQGFTLFPGLTVWQNLCFARGASAGVARHWLARLKLDGLEERSPASLSGGQRQRVALAQALCGSPKVLLLDEPFSALDAPVRLELRRELRKLQHETGIATVLVTHDPEEAAFLADEVIVISDGHALQSGSTRDIFDRPGSPEVARLLGIVNLNHASVVTGGRIDSQGLLIDAGTRLAPGTPVLWSIRPERVQVSPLLDPGGEVRPGGQLREAKVFDAILADVADVGAALDVLITVREGLELQARVPHPAELHIGQRCQIGLPVDALRLWPISASAMQGPPSAAALGAAH